MSRYLAATARDLGALVRGIRKQRGWTQAQLAEHAGLLPKTVSAIEGGGGHVLLANVMRCLSALEVDLSLDSRSGIRTTPDPKPGAIRPPRATLVQAPSVTARPRRPAGTGTVASVRPAEQARTLPRPGPVSRKRSAARALKEKW